MCSLAGWFEVAQWEHFPVDLKLLTAPLQYEYNQKHQT